MSVVSIPTFSMKALWNVDNIDIFNEYEIVIKISAPIILKGD